jgi:hypothetical protein
MSDAKDSRTRVYVTSLNQRNEIDHVDVDATAFQASEAINAAVADAKEFVHFQLANGGAMGIKLSRILHVSEAPPDSDE